MSSATQSGLIAEIKVLLQEELEPLRQAVHGIEVQMTELKGRSIERFEFEAALSKEREKREALESRTNDLDKELTSVKASTKIYIGIATAVASLIASGIAGLMFGTF